MPGLVTSHPISLLVIVTCLVVLAAPARRRINCTRYVFHPVCRGIAAKRSSGSAYSSSSSPSSSSSSSSSSSLTSSSSSSSPRLTEDLLNRLMLLTRDDDERINDGGADKDDEDTPASQKTTNKKLHQQQQQQQVQQQLQRLQQHRQQLLGQPQHHYRGDTDREDAGFGYPYDRYDEYDRELQWRRSLLRVLLMELGSKDFGRQEFYGYYPGFDNEDST